MLLSGTDGQNYTSSIVDRLFYFNLSPFQSIMRVLMFYLSFLLFS